jgi:hypothetical protein
LHCPNCLKILRSPVRFNCGHHCCAACLRHDNKHTIDKVALSAIAASCRGVSVRDAKQRSARSPPTEQFRRRSGNCSSDAHSPNTDARGLPLLRNFRCGGRISTEKN